MTKLLAHHCCSYPLLPSQFDCQLFETCFNRSRRSELTWALPGNVFILPSFLHGSLVLYNSTQRGTFPQNVEDAALVFWFLTLLLKPSVCLPIVPFLDICLSSLVYFKIASLFLVYSISLWDIQIYIYFYLSIQDLGFLDMRICVFGCF